MPQLSNFAEAFLDGFGSLAAIFEPPERPGSTENLIDNAIENPTGRVMVGMWGEAPTGSRSDSLVWLFLISSISLTAYIGFSMFSATRGLEWLLRLNAVVVIGATTLFLRAIVHDVLLVNLKRWRQQAAQGEKAAHRA